MMNLNFTGYVTLPEFLKFCAHYLILDKRLTEEFSFRLLLRRPGAFQRQHSIIDLDDLRFLLTYRYKFKNISQRNRRALGLHAYVDSDGDGGLDVYEYHEFCKKNVAMVRFSHIVQMHMRKCIFGVKYWVLKSRDMAYKHGSSFSALVPLSRMNRTSEAYCEELGHPVLDSWGNVIKDLYSVRLGVFSHPQIEPRVINQDQHISFKLQ